MRVLLLGMGDYEARKTHPASFVENLWDQQVFAGHELVTFGYVDGVDIKIDIADPFERVVERLPAGFVPDFCLLQAPEWRGIPRGIERAPFPTVAQTYDWDWDMPYARSLVQSVDLVIAASAAEERGLQQLGAEHTLVCYPMGVLAEHRPQPCLPIAEREFDLVYTLAIDDVGHLDRSQLMVALAQLDERFKLRLCPHVATLDQYLELLRNAKLVLSHHRVGSLSQRALEAAAQGAVIVETGDEIARYFERDCEYLSVTAETIAERVTQALSDPNALQATASRAQAKVFEQFEARQRLLYFFRSIDQAVKALPAQRQRSLCRLSDAEQHLRRGEIYYYQHYRGLVLRVFDRQQKAAVLALAVANLRAAVEQDKTPRTLTHLATAIASEGFLYQQPTGSTQFAGQVAELLNTALSQDAGYLPAYLILGLLQWRLDQPQLAQQTFAVALQQIAAGQASVDPWALHLRDDDLFNSTLLKPLNRALRELCRQEADEQSFITRYRGAFLAFCAKMLNERGLIEQAYPLMLAAQSDSPRCGWIAAHAARSAALLGECDAARGLFARAVELAPLQLSLRLEQARFLYTTDDDRAALNAVGQALKLSKRIEQLRPHLSEAARLIESFSRMGQRRALPMLVGDCAYQTQQSWVGTLEDALSCAPSATLLSRAVRLWIAVGNVERAARLSAHYLPLLGEVDAPQLSQLRQDLDRAALGREQQLAAAMRAAELAAQRNTK